MPQLAPVEPPVPAVEDEPALAPAAPAARAASPQAALSTLRMLRAGEAVSMPAAATLPAPAPAASHGPVVLPWKSDRLPLIIGAAGHRDLREGDLGKLKSAVASVISTLRRQYLGNDKQTPIVLLSALGEGAEQLIAGEALKQGATLIVPLPLPLGEYRRDFTQRPLAPDAIKHFDDLRLKATATVEIPLAAGSTESGVKVFGPERDRQYREANLFIARHCHVLIALYDGNDDDITVGGAAETVKFNRDGIPSGIRHSARSVLDGAEIGPVIHIVTPRKAVKTTASEVRVVPWGTKAKGASPAARAKTPLDLTRRGGPQRARLGAVSGGRGAHHPVQSRGKGPRAQARAGDRKGHRAPVRRQCARRRRARRRRRRSGPGSTDWRTLWRGNARSVFAAIGATCSCSASRRSSASRSIRICSR